MTEPVVDRHYFKQHFPSSALNGKSLTPERMHGFDAIFDVWDKIVSYDALEWLAYELATAWHETGARMQPVREGFATTDKDAYDTVTKYCAKKGIYNYATRHPNGNSYYGRGYVQLTHGVNYKKMGKHLGMNDRLYDDPDAVLDPALGATILITGMMDGLFRPASGTLFDYFNGSSQRWFDARALINGDKNVKPKWAGGKKIGTIVGDYGKAFLTALKYQ
ncbi:glycoside hydrolase family 19 protein [Methylobacterium sp. R2-1]|uniref:glycoside hydrolase family 19 protein n=1 Tax=Methylobacterium sp. R2-1 TaxID=2587064 RepID=UPI00162301E0|nr:glycoside hydrolase family 19 protein [Methylobacterium sp. R2-1]MBB2962971.1 hypothetical protein [Methylobacterium sp. R2-1]